MAPLYFGIMSMLAICLHLFFGMSITQSFIIIGIISPLIISILVTTCKLYTFSQERLYKQYVNLFIYHFLIFNVLIVNIYKFII